MKQKKYSKVTAIELVLAIELKIILCTGASCSEPV